VRDEWIEDDELRWKKEEKIICPGAYRESTYRDIKEQPPANCPFILEHILSKED